MLVQAQNQKERSNERNKISNDVKDNKLIDQTIKLSDENNEIKNITEVNGDGVKVEPMAIDDATSDKNVIKMEVDEDDVKDELDVYSKDINIDPKTYCKLGHFHLLLEDYPKGNFTLKCLLCIDILIWFLNFSSVSISKVF